jgi:hypothetical protein
VATSDVRALTNTMRNRPFLLASGMIIAADVQRKFRSLRTGSWDHWVHFEPKVPLSQPCIKKV